ncbi:MAG TPA: hypothetical protein GX509_03060 [Firmicutes bacterium]|nr:hypothetical protein [Bacillota bacterium]
MGRFAFITYPPSAAIAKERFPFKGIWLPPWATEPILTMLPPRSIGRIAGVESIAGDVAEGVAIEIAATGRQLQTLGSPLLRRKLNDSLSWAKREGATVVGIGSLDHFLERYGQFVLQDDQIMVTAGLGLSTAARLKAVEMVCFELGIDLADEKVAVLEADHPIGAIAARYLAQRIRYLAISGSSMARLEITASRILHESGLAVTICDWTYALDDAMVVILSGDSAGPDLGFLARYLSSGAVLFDFRRDSIGNQNIIYPICDQEAAAQGSMEALPFYLIKEVYLSIPGNLRIEPATFLKYPVVPPWIAEPMILSMEDSGRFTRSPGRLVSMGWVNTIGQLADRQGFFPVAVESACGIVSMAEISKMTLASGQKANETISDA